MNRQIERPKSLKELQDEILADYVLAVKIHGLRAQFEAGFIYAISNPAWEGYLKIGSAIDYSQRLQIYQTAAPLRDYEFAYVAVTGHRLLAERQALASLSEYRVRQTEWFFVDREVAINRLYNSAREYPYHWGRAAGQRMTFAKSLT